MSMLLMVQAFKLKLNNAPRKLILLKLADNANDEGYCWPSYQHIADMCELSRSTVLRHIKSLEKMGYLTKKQRFNETGNTSNMYHLTLIEIKSVSVIPPSVTVTPPLVSEDHHPSVTVTPESVNESVISNIYSNLDFSKWPELPGKEFLEELLALRKKKKLSNSSIAFNTIGAQMSIAASNGFRVDQCIGQWITSGWSSFKAEYMLNNHQSLNDEGTILASKRISADLFNNATVHKLPK